MSQQKDCPPRKKAKCHPLFAFLGQGVTRTTTPDDDDFSNLLLRFLTRQGKVLMVLTNYGLTPIIDQPVCPNLLQIEEQHYEWGDSVGRFKKGSFLFSPLGIHRLTVSTFA